MSRRSNGEGTVYHRNDGRWEGAAYLLVADGTRRRVRVYAKTQSEARARLTSALERANRGIPLPTRTWRIGDYLDYWLPIVKRVSAPTTYLSYESIVRNYLKPGLGTKQLTRLTVTDLQAFLDAEHAAGRSTRTLQKQRTVLSSALSRAEHEDLVVRNVAHHVKLPVWRRKDIHPWTGQQLRSFLSAAQDDPLYPAFVMLALYGLRSAEVLGLRWEDVDFEGGLLHVHQQIQRYDGAPHAVPTKTASSRRDLPLLSAARRALEEHKSADATPEQLVFRTRFDNPVEGGNLLRSFYRISERVGLPRIKVHHLRHTVATLLKNSGVPDRDSQLILGHANIGTTQRLYQHADLSGQQRGLTQLEDVLMAEPDGEGCRQPQPSGPRFSFTAYINLFGGSSQTRTGDTRLFSSPGHPAPTDMTDVLVTARGRYVTAVLGGAAVIGSRQPNKVSADNV